jgi:GNAT superfamily N-acetyltransferase
VAEAQGRGIGSQLLEAFQELVAQREDGLPGDRHSAKRPLQRALRFEVVGRDEVLGIECTFTSRKPTDLQSSPLTINSTVYPEL